MLSYKSTGENYHDNIFENDNSLFSTYMRVDHNILEHLIFFGHPANERYNIVALFLHKSEGWGIFDCLSGVVAVFYQHRFSSHVDFHIQKHFSHIRLILNL